mgnify:CR=1 FL=1
MAAGATCPSGYATPKIFPFPVVHAVPIRCFGFVTMREAARTIGVIEAAHASARDGRRIALSPEGHWT